MPDIQHPIDTLPGNPRDQWPIDTLPPRPIPGHFVGKWDIKGQARYPNSGARPRAQPRARPRTRSRHLAVTQDAHNQFGRPYAPADFPGDPPKMLTTYAFPPHPVLPAGAVAYAGSHVYQFRCNKDMKERLVVEAFCDVKTSSPAGSPKYKIQVRPPLLLAGRRGADVRVNAGAAPRQVGREFNFGQLRNAIDVAVNMLMQYRAIDYSLMARIVAIGKFNAELPANGPYNPGGAAVRLDHTWVEARRFTRDSVMGNVRALRHPDPDSSNSAHCSAA